MFEEYGEARGGWWLMESTPPSLREGTDVDVFGMKKLN
jgi:hypothetical protein